MTSGEGLRASLVLFVAALAQVVLISSMALGRGAPDLLLVTVVALGLLRGSVPGAVFGFAGGLIVDLLTLETLGITSLVLTLAGFWAGRWAETTGRGHRLAPLLATGMITIVAGGFAFGLQFMLGEEVVAQPRARVGARADAARQPDPRLPGVPARQGSRARTHHRVPGRGGRGPCLTTVHTRSAARPRGGSCRPIPASASPIA